MEEQLKLFPLLTLEEISLRRIAILVWTDSDILACVSSFKFIPWFNRKDRWQSIEDKVKDKLSKLQLPELLLKQLIHKVAPAGFEIRKWKRIHERAYRINIEENGLPGSTKLCWTTAGRINYRETARELFGNEFDVAMHYILACEYGMEDCVASLWEKLPENMKEYFADEDRISSGLRFQWSHILKGDQAKLDRWSRRYSGLAFNQRSFQLLAQAGENGAAGYFLKKLTREEGEASVMRSVHNVIALNNSVIMNSGLPCRGFYYLLTLMTPEQQVETLKAHPVYVFLSFFDTIWPDPFSENAALLWKHLPPSNYALLLRNVLPRYEYTDPYFPHLFQKLLMHSPTDFRRCFVDHEYELGDTPACLFLSAFFEHEDSECAEAVFRQLDAAERVKVVFHRRVLKLFLDNIWRHRWRMVKVCLQEAMLSEEERERLRLELVANFESGLQNSILKKFFDFLDETDSSVVEENKGRKRKLEDCFPE